MSGIAQGLLRSRRRCLTFIFLIAASACPTWAAGTFDEIKANWRSSDILVLDRHGELLQRQRSNLQVRRGQWVALTDVSPALRSALVFSEDKRFYQHSGIDWQAVPAAAWANLFNHTTRGASTLTMQLAALLDEDLQRKSGGRSVLQKIQQSVSAEWLEQRLRKDQILEAYLNLVPFRGELVGIDALSQTLFGKAAHGLDAREAALAAALVRAPNARPAQVAQRACAVLREVPGPMAARTRSHANPAVADPCLGLDLFTAASLQRRDYPAAEGIAPHLARLAVSAVSARQPASASAPASIRTTLHAPLQRFAQQTLQQHLRELRARHVEDGALVVLDNASGQVLAWVGSSGELSAAAEVDGVTALRQPGSTLKPFLYAQALAERRLTAASLLEDSNAQIQTGAGLYIPQNYDRRFKGWVSVRTALASSLNVPAVRTLVLLGPDAFGRQLQRFGLPLKEAGDYYGYSLALGSAEVSLLALSNAYRTLANGGRAGPLQWLSGDRRGAASPLGGSARQAIDAGAAFIVSDILADPLARAPTFGLDSVLSTHFWSAVKTGTSKDMRDNWALGYSQHYTVGVWVGNASGAPMWDVSGTSGAAPIWAAVMRYLHERQPSHAPRPPPGVLRSQTHFAAQAGPPSLEASREEWFLAGTQQARFALDSGANSADQTSAHGQIVSPTQGSIVALDPDIPATHQRLSLRARGSHLRWRIDGKWLAHGSQVQWLPWPGRHVLQTVNAQGQVLDEVHIEVRGAGLKPGRGVDNRPLR